MRILAAMAMCLVLAQCATPDDRRFHVGADEDALVIIGVAEAASNTSPAYRVLWRRLTPEGEFSRYGEGRIFEARTQARESVRVDGVPGEFIVSTVQPGVYALDSVFAVIGGRRVNYVANGIVRGPERPAFEVRPGEAIYLGIWETDLHEYRAMASLWRLDESDLRAVLREAEAVVGRVDVRETHTRSVPCRPHRINTYTERQVC